jgi:hypothetical protein
LNENSLQETLLPVNEGSKLTNNEKPSQNFSPYFDLAPRKQLPHHAPEKSSQNFSPERYMAARSFDRTPADWI